ncbi:YfdQ family protein [Yersinia sp. 2542 StPb PI]|uniref:YfdQ family protein n=1 Tax=Yersinia sp. 2542 StPb PI TaxID=3117408 RepID=UPI003B27EE9F
MSQQLDSSAITEVRDMVLTSIIEKQLNRMACDTIALPAGVSVKSLEQFQVERYRFRGAMETSNIDEFVKYSSGYAGDGVRCFIDADEMRAQTIFNIGTLLNPGHADNTASLSLKKTAPFRELLNIDGRKQTQKELAEWLEDYREFLLAFDADGVVLDIKKAVGAVRRITIEQTSSADHEDQDFSAKRSVMESVEAKSKDVMPAAFEFKCVPYEGLGERRFKLRYSILTGGNVPVLVLRIVQLEAEEEKIAVEFLELLTDKFKDVEVETFIGKFKA